jgi:isopentenyl-diphosphate delta-isomerase
VGCRSARPASSCASAFGTWTSRARGARPGWLSKCTETIIATGGIASGIDVAKSIALGATLAGVARPVLQALLSGGRPAAEALLDGIEAELRATMLLVGASSLAALRTAPKIVVGELAAWLEQG